MKIFRAKDDVDSLMSLINTKHCFIRFHAPWCGHCVAMQKDWNDMLSSFEEETFLEMYEYTGDDEIVIGEIDNKTLSKLPDHIKKQIKGFPTMAEIQDGKIKSEYRGDRSKNDLYIWILINSEPKNRPPPKPKPEPPKPMAEPPKPKPEPPKPKVQPKPKPEPPKPKVQPKPEPQNIIENSEPLNSAYTMNTQKLNQQLPYNRQMAIRRRRFSMQSNHFAW